MILPQILFTIYFIFYTAGCYNSIIGSPRLVHVLLEWNRILNKFYYTHGMLLTQVAVSYTHLDVYKRQFQVFLYHKKDTLNRQAYNLHMKLCLLYTSRCV